MTKDGLGLGTIIYKEESISSDGFTIRGSKKLMDYKPCRNQIG